MSGIPTEAEAGLMAYMVGWRIGAKGGFLTPGREKHPECARGFERGRVDAEAAYATACGHYGARLSPLRSEPTP